MRHKVSMRKGFLHVVHVVKITEEGADLLHPGKNRQRRLTPLGLEEVGDLLDQFPLPRKRLPVENEG